ncbi:hypothetical protein H5300_23430 [Vibrio sp. SG41-7]|uniref:hypothetical protein n=1 Tax=Vibrio sp. SG41-7 TaxID=2760973 RepID=UPI0016024E7F|nr:hypothetical protein [Vibrio sp. SG41-7]MBB1466197.1 hypothetical protein [Vibrio sp. SG41-7]
MSFLLQNKEKLHGKIYRQGKCIGSGVPFLSQDRAFVATCHHVLFAEDNPENICNIEEISLKVGQQELFASKLVSDFDNSKISDVSIIELITDDVTANFANISLSIEVDVNQLTAHAPEIITSHPFENTVAQVPLNQRMRSVGTHSIESTVRKDTFHNFNKGRGGAKEYTGVSGSGIFITLEKNIALVCIFRSNPTTDSGIIRTFIPF